MLDQIYQALHASEGRMMAASWAVNAKDEATKLVFLNYCRLLQEKPLLRPPVRRVQGNFDKEPRVSVFADRFTNRVHRLSLCAKAFGAQVQLISYDGVFPSGLSLSCFDDVVIANSFLSMHHINKEMKKFNTNIAHCHAECWGTAKLFPFIAAADFPIVVDYYDLNHGLFLFWPVKGPFEENRFFEKVCFSRADGICMRSPLLRKPIVRNIYTKGTPVALFQDPIISSWCSRHSYISEKENVNILVDALHADTYNEILAFLNNVIDNACKQKNIHIHLLRAKGLEGRYAQKNVSLYGTIPYTEYHTFLAKMDAMLEMDCPEYDKACGLAGELFARNITISGLEANLVFIYPKRYSFMYQTISRTRRAIPYEYSNLSTPSFWETLPEKIRQVQREEPNREWLTETKIAPRLKKFYRRVIQHAVRIRGME